MAILACLTVYGMYAMLTLRLLALLPCGVRKTRALERCLRGETSMADHPTISTESDLHRRLCRPPRSPAARCWAGPASRLAPACLSARVRIDGGTVRPRATYSRVSSLGYCAFAQNLQFLRCKSVALNFSSLSAGGEGARRRGSYTIIERFNPPAADR